MSATPTSTTANYDAIRKAGSKFGLDLASLFDDEESGDSYSGFEGLQPGFRVTRNIKGTPGTLGYKAPRVQSGTVEFSLSPKLASAVSATPSESAAPATGGATGGGGGGGGTQVRYIEKPQEKIYQGYAGGRSVLEEMPEYGGIGFGQGDLEKARAEGYSDESIRKYLETFKGMIGPKAAEGLGIAAKPQAEIFGEQGVKDAQGYYAPGVAVADYVPVYNQPAEVAASRGVSEGAIGLGTLASMGEQGVRNFIAANPNVTVGAGLQQFLGR